MRSPARLAGLMAIAVLSACSLRPVRAPRPAQPAPPPAVPAPPANVGALPDAVPHFEPRSKHGNPPFYDVFGKRYFVLADAAGYRERGVASWYGPGFHAVRTSTGEPYDMYAMTAAHKTLPLPCYVRVTNVSNGKSVVLRVNDRGPFVGNRIIDLSYAAAAKLDMLRNGTAFVEVQSVGPGGAAAAPDGAKAAIDPAGQRLYVQAGAYASRDSADHLAARLREQHIDPVSVSEIAVAGRVLYRVRVGPVSNVSRFDEVVQSLSSAGVSGAALSLD
jgi:rare lipoprotein A